MEYLAKITGEWKDGNLLKYDFVDLNTGKEDWFYHSQKLNYIPIYAGRLKLFWDEEQRVNFWQSFEQDINSYVEGVKFEKALNLRLDKSNRVIEELANKKIKLTPQLLSKLEQTRIKGKKLTQKDISEITGWSERTIRYRKYRWKNPTNEPKKQVGRPRMMDEETRASLYLEYFSNNKKTQQARANSIYQEKGIKVSQQVISYNIRKDTELTRKKGAKRYSGLKMEEVSWFLKEYGWLYSFPNCLALDEFPTHLGEAPQYAWSRKGCSAEVIQTGQKVATFTVIVCIQNINKQGIISCEVIKNEKNKERKKKGTNALHFYNYLKSINLPTNEKYYLLLDNASIHRTTKELRELGLSIEELVAQKNIVLVYFPKCVPQIDPVELCNNFIRGRIKSEQPRTEETLRKVIKEAVDLLNQKDLTEYFRHCQNYFYVVKNGK